MVGNAQGDVAALLKRCGPKKVTDILNTVQRENYAEA